MIVNPVTGLDYPDVDIIRVEDVYYMVSTTMHFMPGCVILRSYDLVNWEIASYVYDGLDNTPAQRLEGNENCYGKGMWAASLRYHKGIFYICFVANDTQKTYLYQADKIEGPWQKQYIEGFYHDCSLLFDDDKVYITYGNTEIYLTELEKDLSGPKPGGLHRMIIKDDREKVGLGYEGAHFYKIRGKYYVFLIHWPKGGTARRTEACFMADSLHGEFVGKEVLDDDMGYHNQGVAQGGIVDTPDGEWYGMMFQDRGAVGRIPVLVPMHWEEDFPVFGESGRVPHDIQVKSTRPEYIYEPLTASDSFRYKDNGEGRVSLKKVWQWNHTPDHSLWSVTARLGHLRIHTDKICHNVCEAVNTLTQRMSFPSCEASVTVDGSELQDGDYAGICALQGCYGLIAVTRQSGKYYLVMLAKAAKDDTPFEAPGTYESGMELARVPIDDPKAVLKVKADFAGQRDEAEFFYESDSEWKQLGTVHKLYFKLDHFTGCRVGLFVFSTKEKGGIGDFSDFQYVRG